MKSIKISETVIRRLPIYLRYLHELHQKQIATVSSNELGQKLDFNPAQIRKDLAYFGEFGKKGIGYDVDYLIKKIRQILKMNNEISVAIVGAGNLGRALSNYNVYLKDKMRVIAIFDSHPLKIGEKINNLTVLPVDQMQKMIEDFDIKIGIITVPASEAQSVAEQLVQCGVKAILNFAPVTIKVSNEIRVHYADFTIELHSLAYYLELKH